LSTAFNLNVLSNKAVCIYQTSATTGTSVTKQLIHGRDYTFNSQDFYIDDSVVLNNGDILTTYEYDSTDGSYVPSTPTKLGMWPAYVPQIYLDTTLITPKNVIQGHDGSVILAYNDYRDALILELESRIYNNLKVKYNPDIFDITEIIPSYNRKIAYSLSEYNNVLAPSFYKWTGLIGSDFSKPINYNVSNPFTYNYSDSVTPDGTQNVPGYWRGIYRWILDTDRPHLCPWEMLGFSVMPQWWISLYGPAPYTSDNLPMWQDISLGAIKEPGKPVAYLSKFAKPFLMKSIPVDSSGNLKDPNSTGLAKGMITPNATGDYVFGDIAPVETAWRRSSHYPFSVITASMLLTPANTFGTLIDRSRIVRNLAGQIVYKDTGLRLRPADIKLPNLYDSKTRVQTAGIINYVVDLILNYIFSNNIESYNEYSSDLSKMSVQLGYRVGSFTNKDQFNLLLESKTPLSSGSIFVPPEDYDVFLNTSSPAIRLTYSGVRITKLQTGYQIQGYSRTQPYFKYYNYLNSGTTINIGGISHSYSQWTSNEEYLVGNVVVYDGRYYSTIVQHTANDTFNPRFFQTLTSLPVTGGVSAAFRTNWDKTELLTIPYGTELTTVQDVVDFLLGYEQYLISQGFTFDTYNKNLGVVSNWSTSAKEFMFWTTQNWSAGQDKWNDWIPNKPIAYGTIVRYEGEYYSALTNVPSSPEFNPDDFNKLEGLSIAGAGVISLSPAAASISFKTSLTVVDDIGNKFNDYEIFKVDGTPITPNQLDSYRTGNVVTYTPRTSAGIYCASFYLIQHEHVIIINNTDIFNDVIYNPPSGYRRERIKVSGYITTDWYGGLDIPGFIFDAATVKNWQPWKDYNMGDIIAYQGYNYSANIFLPGTSTFVPTSWTRLAKTPTSQILPNWTNLATQFTDFYSLEVDNFDAQQQKIAQHLIGYQSRQYLSNIIQDPVSEFKFYQGMIREKGTQNVLNKLFNVLSSDNEESLTFYEEWALRVGQYGASEAFENIEFVLDEDKFKNNPQGVLLINRTTTDLSPVIIQQTPNDVYLAPHGYSSAPFPSVSNYQPLLRSAGYVNPSDVFVTVGSLDELATKDITTFKNGAYIWVTFDSPKSQFWNVYRFTDTSLKISEVTYDSKTKLLTLVSDNIVKFVEGSYIGISQVTGFSGFYKVASVTLNTFVVSADLPSWKPPFDQQDSINIFVLTSQRTTDMDSIGEILTPEFSSNELIWVDNTAPNDGKWATWKYNQVYSKSDIINEKPTSTLGFGKILAVTTQGDLLAVGDNTGAVTIYYKSGTTSSWSEKQVIPNPNVWGNGNLLPSSIKFSPDGLWLAVGSKYAGAVSSSLSSYNSGVYDSTHTYSSGSIVTYSNQYYKTEKSISPLYASVAGYVTVTSSGAIFDVVVVPTSTTVVEGETVATNGYYQVNVRYGGVGYKIGSVIKVLGSLLGGVSPSDDLTFKVATVNSVNGIATITNLQGVPSSKSNSVLLAKTKANVSGIVVTGSGALFNVATHNGANLENYSIPTGGIISGGTGYLTGDKFIIPGSVLGGEDIVNDLTLIVTAIAGVISGYSSRSGNTAWTKINYLPAAVTTYGNNVESGNFGKGNTYQITSLGATGFFTDFTLIGTATTDANGTPIVWSTVRTPRIGDFFVATNTGAVTDGNFVIGKPYVVIVPGTTNFALLGATGISTNTVGTIFTATATSSSGTPGTGVAFQGSGTATEQINATQSIYQEQGVVTLYRKDLNDFYSVVDTIVSLNAASYENFGSNLEFGDNALYISASGYNSEAGRVYTLFYQTTNLVSVFYNPVGSFTSTEPNKLVISSNYPAPVSYIRLGMTVHGTGFTSGQYVVQITSINSVLLSAPPDSTPSGEIQFLTQGWTYRGDSGTQIISGTAPGQGLGIDTKISKDNSILAVSTYSNVVKVYKRNSTTGLVVFLENIIGTDNTFGQGLDVSDNGAYIAISDYALNNQGVVNVYKLTNNSYNTIQPYVITNQYPQSFSSFGSKIAFMNDYNTLVIYSEHGDTSTLTTIDNNKTTLDKDSTNFVTKQPSSGRVDVYDMYATKWVFSESLATGNTVTDGYGAGVAVCDNQIIVSAPYAQDRTYAQSGLLYAYIKPKGALSWTVDCTGVAIADVKKIKQAFLYNKDSGTLLKYLDVIDPGQGKITGPADAEIQYKAYYDPAVYSYSTTGSSVNSDPTTFWTTAQVGKIWWNLSTTKFVNAYLNDVTYRNNSWNTLAQGASVDIYEWVQTKLLPADWDKQADTPAGLALGISGTSLYGNNAYSVTQKYNNITKKLVNTYYFWVKNKNVVPTTPNRHLSALQVSNLIANPRGEAYTYLALIGTDSFSLVNARSYLANKDVVLSVEYWLTDKTDQNVHSQWSLISDDINVDLPITLEKKWFDSLCGVDLAGRSVPDTKQPPKLRYGIENRPRQSMFVNRIEALKQFVERANITLQQNQISEGYNLTKLESYDTTPTTVTGLYDQVQDTDADLAYININSFRQAKLTPVIVNGTITSVTIDFEGSGYGLAPSVEIVGTGKNAQIATVITNGKITEVIVRNSGIAYDDSNTTLVVRSYCVLINSDSLANGNWSIYSWTPSSTSTGAGSWSRILTQAYDVRKYWNYTDWYATGYSQYSSADYLVSTFVGLNDIVPAIGELVKVTTVNAGGWLLLEKYANSTSVDWTQSYRVVGIQKGTIQLSSKLYNFVETDIGYDSDIFDNGYDVVASTELRVILNAIKDNIFIGNLKQNYLDLFIASIKYAHSEQVFIDWAFKTSFVRATHNVGNLDQPVNYPVDNIGDFENYVNEVKPYRTKLREYISNYKNVDMGATAVSDFDLQPLYTDKIVPLNTIVANGKIDADNSAIQTYPWKFWLDNVGFVVTEIILIDSGSNYVNPPSVVFTSDSGAGVSATAYIANGVVNRIILISSGSGYLSTPTITLTGGVGIGGKPAKAIAIIGKSVVRSSLVGIKFDRTNSNYYITQIEQTATFTGTGSKIQFALKWAPDVTIGTSVVTISGVPVLRELYSLSIVKKKVKGSTQYTGTITFKNAPANGSVINVKYIIDKSVMSATDRIQYYYNPLTGQLGKELSQLMLGVDYGGVQVNGLGFSLDTGWGTTPYYSDKWDNFDSKFTDYFVTVAANAHTFDQLPYVADFGTEINIYKASTTTDSHVSDGLQTKYTYNILADNPVVTLVNNIETTSIATTYQPTGSYHTTLKVANTTVSGKTVLPGMTVVGNGFASGQTVTSVGLDGQTVTLSAAPDSNPANKQFLNVTGVNQNSITGSGAIFNVVTTETGYSAQVVNGGTGYTVSLNFGAPNTIKILGTAVGGTTPLNDVTLIIASVGSSSAGLPGMIVSVTASGTPAVVPLEFTFNYPGSKYLTLKNTTGLSVTDVITCPSVTRLVNNKTVPSIAYATVIKSIDTVNNKVGLGTLDPITNLNVISVIGSGTKVTMTFATQPSIPYPVNSLISITGFIPNKYNGIYTVTDASISSMSFSSTVSAAVTTYGTITTVIDSILFQTIPNNTTVVFTKTLKESLEANIFADGTIRLLEPANVGTNVVITGTINPVRLDDPKFGTINQKNDDAIMQTPFPILSTTVTSPGRYITMPTVTVGPSDLNAPLYTATTSAVMTAIDVSYNGNNNGTGYRVGDILITQPSSGVTPAVMNNSIITNNMLTVGTVASGNVQVGMVLTGSGIAHRQAPIITTGASCDTTTGTVTLTFASLGSSYIPFAIGQPIIVAGIAPSTFNGTYNVTSATTTSVSYAKVVTLASFTAKIGNTAGTSAGNRLVVTAISSGALEIGQTISGTGVSAGITITSQVSGTSGSTGVYIISSPLFVNNSTYMHSVASQTASGTITSNAITYITGNISGTGAGSKWTVNLKQTTALVGSNISTTVTGAGAVIFEVTRVASNTVPPVGPIDTLSIVSSTSFTGSLDQNNQQLIGGSGQNGTISVIYGVKSLVITNPGSGYLNNPVITISPGLQTATATATIQQFANGLPKTIVSLPSSYTVNAGDEFILRKSTSDGSIAPPNQDFDTAISGGDLAYSTATGIAADDIVIDGDGLVTPTTSPAPEEVVPGQVVDTLAIKVYDQSSSGSAKIKVDNYVANGSQSTYKINQQMNSPDALVVKVGFIIKQHGSDFTVDFQNNTITLNTTPSKDEIVSIFSLSSSGTNVLDNDYFIGDGVTIEFVTKANWSKSVTSLVYINGVVANPVLFKTDKTYDLSNAIGFRFAEPPAAGSVVNYIVTSGIIQNFAITQRQTIAGNNGRVYPLTNPIGVGLPVEQNMIVILNDTVLRPPSGSYFTIGNNIKSFSPNFAEMPFNLGVTGAKISDIGVYVDGKKLSLSSDYSVNTATVTVTILNHVYNANIGKTLVLTLNTYADYTVDETAKTITFKSTYSSSDKIEILSSYNQSSLDIERTTIVLQTMITFSNESVEYHYFKELSRGIMRLDRPVIDEQHVWLARNNVIYSTLLVPGVDYILLDDKASIQLAPYLTSITDTFTLMTFGNNVLSSNISYMQFKDMLNRVIYKRLSKNKQTRLAKDLHWNDVEILVEDASNFDIPNISTNRPGIIEIRGERIEFFAIAGNTLKQIRRGTLGTGIYSHNKIGTFVQDIGSGSTIPYTDSTLVQNIIADGVSSSHQLTLGVALDSAFTDYNSLFEVFVGGDNDTVRLKKAPYSVFDINKAPYSPAGDVIYPADFTVSNVASTGAQLTLTNPVTQGTKITVVHQTGKEWDGNKNNPVNILDSDSAIANFIKASPGIWYSGFSK
jgi:hypothetical protein